MDSREDLYRAASIAAELDFRIKSLSHGDSNEWVPHFEAYILDLAHRSALNMIERYAEKNLVSYVRAHDARFQLGVNSFDFYIAGDIRSGNNLVIRIENIDPSKPRPQRKAGRAQISEPGRYRGIRLYTDSFFEPIRDSLAEGIAKDLEAGYRWISHQLLSSVRTQLRGIGDDIRLHIRKRLPVDLDSSVWPYIITKGKGIYLSDDISRQLALNRASQGPMRVHESPPTLMANFATRLLDSDDLFSTEAIKQRKTITGDLRSTPYAHTGFDIAERAVLRFSELAVKPLVWEGDVLLVVGFPVSQLSLLDEALEREKGGLAALLQTKSKEIKKVVNDLTKQEARYWVDPKLAAWGAHFLRSFIEGL